MSKISQNALVDFNRSFDSSREDKANETRGDFLKAFPLSSLSKIKIKDYVIGSGKPTFCAYVEAKTKEWASVQGATASKFGIYFGKTKSDVHRRYRFTQKFGSSATSAFSAVRSELNQLIEAGKELDFAAIDENKLSQMFKAKILSLYFPETFMNVCSEEHINLLSDELGISDQSLLSERQHLLVEVKKENQISRNWSNPKFMRFLYANYIWKEPLGFALHPPQTKTRKKVNMREIAAEWDRIGKESEEYALKWERKRLIGINCAHLAKQISDFRDAPSTGYDFSSFETPNKPRLIEVKSVAKIRGSNDYRFFLSENKKYTSNASANEHSYFFYLVFWDKNGPRSVEAVPARRLYQNADVSPCAYVVRIGWDEVRATL